MPVSEWLWSALSAAAKLSPLAKVIAIAVTVMAFRMLNLQVQWVIRF
jgi:hypothetical protein